MTVTAEKMAVWSFQKFPYLICTAYLAKFEIISPFYVYTKLGDMGFYVDFEDQKLFIFLFCIKFRFQ